MAYDPSMDPDRVAAAAAGSNVPSQLPQINAPTQGQMTYGSSGSGPQVATGIVAGGGVTSGAYADPSQAAQYTQQPSFAPQQPTGLQPATPVDIGVRLDQAGTGENVSAAMLNHYGAAGTPTVTNNAQSAYQNFATNAGPAPDANMNAYYDNASRNSANTINRQMAARGSYGSSNAVGVLSNAETNLRAQQAKDEASYGLQRAQYGLSRAGTESSLAGTADASSRANSADERDWMSGLSDLGFKNQDANISRGQTLLGDEKGAADTSSAIQDKIGQREIDAQKDLLVQQLMAQNGMSLDAATAAANKVNDQRADSQDTTNTLVSGAKAYNTYSKSV